MNDFFSYSGWLLSIVSIVLSIFFYRRSQSIKRLNLHQLPLTSIVFPTNIDTYKIRLNDKNVGSTLTQVHLLLRNRGNTGIEKNDIRTEVKIEFEIKAGELLGAYVAGNGIDKPPPSLRILQHESALNIDWDYIDSKDQFSIVAYTSGEFKNAKLRGHFKRGIVVTNTVKSKSASPVNAIFGLLAIFFAYPAITSEASILLYSNAAFFAAAKRAGKTLAPILSASILANSACLAAAIIALTCAAGAARTFPTLKRWAAKSQLNQ